MLRFSMVKYAILGLGCLGLSSCGSADRSSTRGAVLDRDGGLVCTVAKDGEPIQVSQQGTKEFVDLYNDLKELSGRAQGKRKLTEKTGPDYSVWIGQPDQNGRARDETTVSFHLYMPKMADVDGEGLFEIKPEIIKRITDSIKTKFAPNSPPPSVRDGG